MKATGGKPSVLLVAPPPKPELLYPEAGASRDERDCWWSWWALQDKQVALLLEPNTSEWTKGGNVPCKEPY